MNWELNELYERKYELEEEIENYFDDEDDYPNYGDRGYQDLLNELSDVKREIRDILNGDDDDVENEDDY